MFIPEEFYDIHGIKSIHINKKLSSNTNNVYWIKAYKDSYQSWDLTIKLYKNEKSKYSFNKEVDILKHLSYHGVPVPEIYYSSNRLIIMEHISGEVLLEKILNSSNNIDDYRIINELIIWFESFYRAMKKWKKSLYVKADVSLTNFIFKDKIYGIDFDGCQPGIIEEDIGKLCAFILTYSTEFNASRFQFINRFIQVFTQELRLDTEVVIREMKNVIAKLSEKTINNYSQESINAIINSWRNQKIVYKVSNRKTLN